MTNEEKMNRHYEIAVVLNGKSKFIVSYLGQHVTVYCLTDSRPVQYLNMTRRAFFALFRGYKKIKYDKSHLLIKENLWGYQGPKTKLPRYFVKE
mgnify:CR=1 FL=1